MLINLMRTSVMQQMVPNCDDAKQPSAEENEYKRTKTLVY
jgi:hypothetical protein